MSMPADIEPAQQRSPIDRRGSAVVTTPSDLEIRITRTFAVPAALVFRAWTTPDLVRRWWGLNAPVVVCDIDLRVGGSWRYVTRSADGVELGWHGTYRDIDAPFRLVTTEVFEGYPDGEAINTWVLTEVDGATVLTVTARHSSIENRDGHLNSGMEGGLQLVLNQFETILHELAAPTSTAPTSTASAVSAAAPSATEAASQVSDAADRYRKIAGRFTARAREVPAAAWENPAPCAGWVARDVVRHMVEWMPGLLGSGAQVQLPSGPSVDIDPVGAWTTMSDGIQALLDSPDIDSREFVHDRAGRHSLAAAIDMFCTGDILVHTWDLARATGLDETLDADEVERMFVGMEPMDEMLRMSGQYGPRVAVPGDADMQTKLIAFVGRQP